MSLHSITRSETSSRRNFVRKAGFLGAAGLGSVGLTTGVVGGRQRVRGRIQQANNKPAVTDRIDVAGGLHKRTTTNRGGHFEIDPEGASRVVLGFYESVGDSFVITSVKDGSPDMYTSELMDVKPHLGNIRLPDAHLLNVKVEDENGKPVTDKLVRCKHIRDVGGGTAAFGSGRQPVNDDGLFQYRQADEPGIELVGQVEAQVWSGDRQTLLKSETFELDADRTVTFKL